MPCPLLADVSNEWTTLLITGATLFGGGIVWLANWWAGRQVARRKDNQEDKKEITDHLEMLVIRQGEEITALRKDSQSVNDKLTYAISHVMYLEGIIESKGFQFRPFKYPGADTASHQSLHEGP